MNVVLFILGLGVGFAFHCWRQNQLNRKFRGMLQSISDSSAQVCDLPLASLLRREINYLNEQCIQLEGELKIWEDLVEKFPWGYLRIDEENQLLWCNHQARELLQIDRWQPGQVRLFLELVRSYELDQLIQKTRDTQQEQVQEWQFYVLSYQGDNKVRSLPLKAFGFSLPAQEVVVFLQNQQPLVDVTQDRDRFLSDLTHELRTPLTAINAVAEILQKRLKNPEKQWVEQMLRETSRLIKLIEDWLDVSLLNQSPYENLQYETLELKSLIFNCWQTLEAIATPKNLFLSYHGLDQLYLRGDPLRLSQVFLNLFDNAINYSLPEKEILVEVKQLSEELIQVNIIDSGAGFLPSDLPHVFQRLYRGDQSRVRVANTPSYNSSFVSNGSGLGLSIVKEIILAHGGSIEAKNHSTTGGAWLQFTLPR